MNYGKNTPHFPFHRHLFARNICPSLPLTNCKGKCAQQPPPRLFQSITQVGSHHTKSAMFLHFSRLTVAGQNNAETKAKENREIYPSRHLQWELTGSVMLHALYKKEDHCIAERKRESFVRASHVPPALCLMECPSSPPAVPRRSLILSCRKHQRLSNAIPPSSGQAEWAGSERSTQLGGGGGASPSQGKAKEKVAVEITGSITC